MATSWTKVSKASGQSWTKVAKATDTGINSLLAGAPIGLLLALTYGVAITSGSIWTKVVKASGQVWTKVAKAS